MSHTDQPPVATVVVVVGRIPILCRACSLLLFPGKFATVNNINTGNNKSKCTQIEIHMNISVVKAMGGKSEKDDENY